MDTNTWDFENEDFLSIAKMKQPLKEGVTFRNHIQEFVVQLIDNEYPCDKSVYDVVYEYIMTLVLEDDHISTSRWQEEQVHVDFISEGTKKQGFG